MEVNVRLASPADAEAIVGIHFASVHETAAASYPVAVLESWSTTPNEVRFARVRRAMADAQELFIVAEVDGAIMGFGSIVPAAGELRALFVHPNMGRRGIGAALLRRLEAMAVEHGARQLQMDASINAESFYHHNGYQLTDRGFHRLASGVEMACVKMQKRLT